MKKSKLLAALATSALVFSMGANVFAEDTTIDSVAKGQEGASVVAEGTLTLPTVNVVVPGQHSFSINPYKIDDKPQINSTIAHIANNGTTAVSVTLKSTTVAFGQGEGSKAKPTLVADTGFDKVTTKSISLNLAAKVSSDEVDADGFTGDDVITTPIMASTKPVALGQIPAKQDETVSSLYLKYDGKAVTNPVAPWATGDKVTVTSIYTFAPVSAAE